jgi:hypothetical protein
LVAVVGVGAVGVSLQPQTVDAATAKAIARFARPFMPSSYIILKPASLRILSASLAGRHSAL